MKGSFSLDHPNPTPIYGPEGHLGQVSASPSPLDGNPVSIEMADGRTLLVSGDLLRQQPDGSYYLSMSKAQLEQADIVIPLAAEQLRVEKKSTTRRVRFTRHVDTHVERTEDTGFKEEIEVEHIPIEREVDAPPVIRSEGNTTIVPLVEEVLVVEKRLILQEEVHITVTRRPNPPVEATLRSERLEIEPPEADA